jgi:Tol biopolymer transport system component
VIGIYLIKEDGSGKIQLTHLDAGSVDPITGEDVNWSPDGQWIAFVGSGTPQAIKSDGSQLVKLSTEKAYATALVWSPDSSQVAYYNPTSTKMGIVVAGLDGSRSLIENPALTIPNVGWNLAWTPDGKQLVVYDYKQKALVSVSTDGKEVSPLVSVTGWVSRMAWSPDGTQLAFIDLPVAGNSYGELKVVNADGSGLTTLASQINDASFVWKVP